MAKVFSPEEVKRGYVPRLVNFEKMANIFMALPNPEPQTGTIEKFVYGSVDSGSHDIRSDLDCLIIWPVEMSFDGINKYLMWLRDASGALHIPLEPIAVRRDIALHGEHGLEPLFLEYLKQEEPNVKQRVGLPATRLALPTTVPSGIEIFHSFAAAKTEKFTKAATSSKIDFNTYQRALELVRALDRKLARIPGVSDDTDTLPKLAKSLGLSNIDVSAIYDATLYLNTTNSAYNVLLAETMIDLSRDPEASLEEYTAKLEQWYLGVIQSAVKLSIGSHAIINSIRPQKAVSYLYD